MLKDSIYDKIKILNELSSLAWFIKNHAKPTAKKEKETKCLKFYETLEKELAKHINALKAMVCKAK